LAEHTPTAIDQTKEILKIVAETVLKQVSQMVIKELLKKVSEDSVKKKLKSILSITE
jgi:hypothetical protein